LTSSRTTVDDFFNDYYQAEDSMSNKRFEKNSAKIAKRKKNIVHMHNGGVLNEDDNFFREHRDKKHDK